jgi:hypothetical protein
VPAIGHLLLLDSLAIDLDSFARLDHYMVPLERVGCLPMDIRMEADRMAWTDLESYVVRDCRVDSTRRVADKCLPLSHMSELQTRLMAWTGVHKACYRMALEGTSTMALARAATMDGPRKNFGVLFGVRSGCVAEKAIDQVLHSVITLMAWPEVSHAHLGGCFLVAESQNR